MTITSAEPTNAVAKPDSGGIRMRVLMEPRHGARYDDILALALATERAGFDAFFRSDHLLGGDPDDPGYRPTDCWTTLAGLARDTSRVRLGALMTAATFRAPGLLAAIVASVDDMSGGRVELGIGAAWYAREHAAFGLPFPPVKERFDRLEEQLAVITGLWHAGPGDRRGFSFDGRHYRVDDNRTPPRVTQRPHPPIIVGGGGPQAHAGHRRPVRHRVQRRARRRTARTLRAIRAGVRGDRPRPGRGPALRSTPGGDRVHASRGRAPGGDRQLAADPRLDGDRVARIAGGPNR